MKRTANMPAWFMRLSQVMLILLLLALNVMIFLRARQEPSALLWAFLSLAVVASVTVVIVSSSISRVALKAKCTSASDEMLAAADWIMRRIMPQSGPKIAVTDTEAIQKRIEQWYHERQDDVARQVNERTEEWTRELQMATDFQLAMMQRPYPQIPEIHITGRLRLNFYHRYQAASGLGGDFFDIFKVDRDVGGVFISDVMGHGTRSALITSILRTLMADALTTGRNAPHFLTQAERECVEEHPVLGEQILRSAGVDEVLPWVRHHHRQSRYLSFRYHAAHQHRQHRRYRGRYLRA